MRRFGLKFTNTFPKAATFSRTSIRNGRALIFQIGSTPKLHTYRLPIWFFYWLWMNFETFAHPRIELDNVYPKPRLEHFKASQIVILIEKRPATNKWNWLQSIGANWVVYNCMAPSNAGYTIRCTLIRHHKMRQKRDFVVQPKQNVYDM